MIKVIRWLGHPKKVTLQISIGTKESKDNRGIIASDINYIEDI